MLPIIESRQFSTHKIQTGPQEVRIGRPSPPFLRSGPIYMKDAHSAELNEKSHFRFFELWLIAFTIYGDTRGAINQRKTCSNVAKFTGEMRIDLRMIF